MWKPEPGRRLPRLLAFWLGGLIMLGWAAGIRAETVTGSIPWGGLTRTYRLHLPPARPAGLAPLVLVLHGGGGAGRSMAWLTRGAFNDLADREGFLAVYPDGFERHWNDGRSRVRYRSHREKIDDVGFLAALIDYLVKERRVDPRKVYVTGMSNGALMAQRLACQLTGKIAAIASVAGTMPADLAPRCVPSRPISVMLISGTADPLMPYGGGEVGTRRIKLGKVLSVAETVKFWVGHNRCAPTPSVTRLPHRGAPDGTRVRREVYGGGRDGAEVILYTVEGGGHTWPRGRHYLPEWLIGKTSKDLNAAEVIWHFFEKHSMK
jgi:polyhydroxybutyrate depolymerase